MRFDFFAHVAVGFVQCKLDAIAVFRIEEIHGGFKNGAHFFHFLCIEIADNVNHFRLFHIAAELIEMEETFVAFSVLRAHLFGEHAVKFHAEGNGVDHLAFSRSRVDAYALNIHFAADGVEAFVLHFAESGAV